MTTQAPPLFMAGGTAVIAFELTCTDCPTVVRYTDLRTALAARRDHVCEQPRDTEGLFTCASCGRKTRYLVDDGPLCIRCDNLHYPELGAAS